MPHPIAHGQPGLGDVDGTNRCRCVDVAVVDDFRRLCDCSDLASLHHVLAISGRGVPVITRASWVLATGDFEMVPKESVLRHVPLVAKKKVVFEYDEYFKARTGFILEVLVWLSKQTKSIWEFRQSSDSAVGDGGTTS